MAEPTQATPPMKGKAEVLTDVYSLATQFSTCVEAFNLIHPSKDTDHAQKVALAKLGLQQGRLLIFGDAVGIAAPPPNIARHMVPSHPGLTNPEPYLPVHFSVRDERLDDPSINERVRKALNEISGRPGNLSRDELMEKYGLKSPKHFSKVEYPALDTNRLEGFREKFALLQDLLRQTGVRTAMKRNMSMTTSHWTVKNSERFDQFVKTVRVEVDTLIELLDVKEQVDRGTRSDIRCMGWHPDLSGPLVHHDWAKLRLIREACEADYPEYIEVIDTALQYINEEVRETSLANRRASLGIAEAAGARRKSDYDIRTVPPEVQVQVQAQAQQAPNPTPATPKTHLQLSAEKALNPSSGKEKRPGSFKFFKFKSWSKSYKDSKQPPKNADTLRTNPQRSLSVGEANVPTRSSEDANVLTPVRSKSVGALPDPPAPLDLDSRMDEMSLQGKQDMPLIHENLEVSPGAPRDRYSLDKNALVLTQTVSSEGSGDANGLYGATTVNSLIDRHDMYQGIGRITTKDIRQKAHEVDGP
jgi:hypothetical protein